MVAREFGEAAAGLQFPPAQRLIPRPRQGPGTPIMYPCRGAAGNTLLNISRGWMRPAPGDCHCLLVHASPRAPEQPAGRRRDGSDGKKDRERGHDAEGVRPTPTPSRTSCARTRPGCRVSNPLREEGQAPSSRRRARETGGSG
jgi:hypothetical protein